MSRLVAHGRHRGGHPGRRTSAARLVCAAVSVGCFTTAGQLLPATAPAAHAATPASTTGSALTKNGSGAFGSLKVTVSQTANLVNQDVSVSWSGAAPTQPGGNHFAVNYLQVMQCWGDDPAGPLPTQCEFGASNATDQRGGAWVNSRQLYYGALVDPLEGALSPGASVPFSSVTGQTVIGNTNQFFDATTTNEQPFGLTSGNGTGQLNFEVQTAFESPGLGCGQLTTSGLARSCWLVVVPRSDREVDGSLRSISSTDQLDSSPLSATNWARRIVFPMGFAPLGNVCPLGAVEESTVGVETIADAITRWQPALCSNGGPVYGYSQVADSVAERQLMTPLPGLAFLNAPVPAAANPAGVRLVYAPVALSGLAIGFDVDYQALGSAPAALQALDGIRVSSLKLTPRLVAKLLTQSYKQGAQGAPYLTGNPSNLLTDPDFLRFNPEYKGLALSLSAVLEPLGHAAAYRALWDWIASNRDAWSFMVGYPDPWGMRVNPFYQALALDGDWFPKQDPYCVHLPTAPSPLCTLDAYPYANSLHDTAHAASRGDTLARTTWDPQARPPTWKKVAAQPTGDHAVLALTDTVAAARFGILTAALQNADGNFVSATPQTLLAGYAAMRPTGAPGVRVPDPGAARGQAYPLTLLTYAVTPPTVLSQPDAQRYAALVRFAVGAGQQVGAAPGQEPAGFVALPAGERLVAGQVAAQIAARSVPSAPRPPVPTPRPPAAFPPVAGSGSPPVGGPAAGGGAGIPAGAPAPAGVGTSGGAAAGPVGGPPAAGRAAAPAARTTNTAAAPSPAGPPSSVLTVARTPVTPVGTGRYALVALLLLAGLATGLGPALPRLVRRLGR